MDGLTIDIGFARGHVPKTKLLKEKLANADFSKRKDREYITELVFLERTMGPSADILKLGSEFRALASVHSKEYLAMLKELDTARYKREQARLEHEKLEDEEAEEEEQQEKEDFKKWWISNGGTA